MTEIAGRLVWVIDAETGAFNSALIRTKAQMASTASSGTKATQTMQQGFAKVAVAAAAAFAAIRVGQRIIGTLIGTATEFELAFTGVTKTTDGLSDNLGNLTDAGRELKDELKTLATEVAGGFSDIAGIAELAGQLGVARGELTEFTRSIANIAVATNLTAEEAATSFAQIANIIGIAQDDLGGFASQFGSAIVDLGNNFATTEADITNFSQRIAGAGSIVGLTGDQIAGISAAFTSVGVQAEAGGTAVQKVLLSMNQAFVQGGEDLTTFADTAGLSVEEFKKVYEEDASQAFENFVLGLGEQGDDAINTLSDLGLEDQRLIRSFLSLSNAGDLVTRTLNTAEGAFETNTALADEASKFNATFAETWNNLKDSIFNVVDSIGSQLLPVLKPLITAITSNEKLLKGLVIGFGALASVFTLLVGAVAIKALLGAIGGLLVGISIPLLPIIAGLAVFAAIGLILNKNWSRVLRVMDVLRDRFDKLLVIMEPITDVLGQIGEFIKEQLVASFKGFISLWETSLQPALLGIYLTLKDSLIPIIDTVVRRWDELKFVIIPLILVALTPLAIAVGAVVLAARVLPPVLNVVIGVLGLMIETVIRVISFMTSLAINIVSGLISAFSAVINFLTEFNVTVIVAIQSIVAWFKELPGKIIDAIIDLHVRAVIWAEGVLDSMVAGFLSAVTAVIDFFKELPGEILKTLGDLGTTLFESGRSLITGFADGIKDAAGAAVDAAKEAVGKVRSWFPSSPAKEGPFSGKGWTLYSGQAISESLAQGIGDSAPLVVDAVASLTDDASLGINNVQTNISPDAIPERQTQQPTAPVTVNVNMSGIMTRGRSDQRAIAKDLIASVNEELSARNLPEIGGGNLTGVIA